MPINTIRVGLICHSHLMREALTNILRCEEDLETIDYTGVSDCSKAMQIRPVNVVLFQYHRSKMACIRDAAEGTANAKIVIIDADLDELDVAGCLDFGVAGFTLTDASLQES